MSYVSYLLEFSNCAIHNLLAAGLKYYITYLTRLVMNLYIQFLCFYGEQCSYFKIYRLDKP